MPEPTPITTTKRTFAASHLYTQPEAHSQQEWEAMAQQLFDAGEMFLAHDHARVGLEAAFPDSLKLKQIAAAALVQVGAIEEAGAILEPLCPDVGLDEGTIDRVFEVMCQTMSLLPRDLGTVSLTPQDRETLARFISELDRAGESLRPGPAVNEEILGLLARIHKERWKSTRNPADGQRARKMYLRAFRQTGGYWTGINAAGMSRLLDGPQAFDRPLAERILQLCEQQRPGAEAKAERDDRGASRDLYWILATIGEGKLLLGDEAEASAHYRRAVGLARGQGWSDGIVSSLRQLRLYRDHGLPVPDELFDLLKPPPVVIFVGHMIDQPGRTPPRFPPGLEPAVREAIRAKLDTLDARIGYSSAACGSDLLFVEAMLDRLAEVHIMLPFRQDDFIKQSVAFAGENWIGRFRRALRFANSVKYVTTESYLDSIDLFDLGARIFQGVAILKARTLETQPHLLAVWDGQVNNLIGGTGEFVSKWRDEGRKHVIDLADLLNNHQPDARIVQASANIAPVPRVEAPPAAFPEPETPRRRPRVTKTLMFADLVGYSRLEEDQVPFFMHEFLEAVAGRLKGLPEQPRFVNTWGDAIFAVMDRAIPIARYALALRDVVRDTDWTGLGFAEMNVRIGLHTGPIFEGDDALTGRTNYYGSHVNRAARLEPVTVPGHIYASEQFVGLLLSEQADPASRADDIHCEYVGRLALAKRFGDLSVYHIRGRSSLPLAAGAARRPCP